MGSRAPRTTGFHRLGRAEGFFLRPRLLAALIAVLAVGACAASAETERLSAALLTRDLGDFRAPGNAKLVLTLPPSLSHMTASSAAGDFLVYVYPDGLSEAEGTTGRYRAGGIYLWRFRSKLFLDARELPPQDRPGPAKIKIVYAPSGTPRAQGMAEGVCRFTTEGVDVVLAVDVSRSMSYNDPGKRRVAAARAFITMAREGGGVGRVGLVTFYQHASVQTPLVPLTEADRIISDLAKVGSDGLTSLDAPLASALSLFGNGSENPVVILLTDGYNEGSFYQNTHRRCAAAGVRLFTVGLTENADHRLLAEMAEATGGIYFRAPTDQDLPEIYARLAAELGKRYLMHADILRTFSGEMTLPVDGTVKRVVAMADGGARMRLTGPDGRGVGAGAASGKIGSVFVGRPGQGDWRFAWDSASPGVSALALFGDTPFFLDVFPPQLQGGTFAVGATLALGSRPLEGGRVWLEPVQGIFARPIELFDDGEHGDGEAGDGVYGAAIDFPNAGVDRFDVTVRASGRAWDKGAFVRQTAGLTIRTPEDAEPPKRGPGLEGAVDFGILYPGETGSAVVTTDLDAAAPDEFLFELGWPGTASGLPTLSSEVTIRPGRQRFDVEITVPENAVPGQYLGTFSIIDDSGVSDETEARVTIGAVVFGDPGVVNLGIVRPGTTASRKVTIPVRADKAVAMTASAAGDPRLVVKPERADLGGGDSAITLEISVSSPIGAPDDDQAAGMVALKAGPGVLDIPVTWTVRAYAAAPLHDAKPPEGLPAPPEGLAEPPSLDISFADRDGVSFPIPGRGGDTGRGMIPPGAAGAGADSPWERAERAIDRAFSDLDGRPGPATLAATPAGGEAREKGRGGDSFWSAWWLYILAALILLILLLLLLSYILYRLGSSRMLRFLIASIIINLILLAVFVALLGSSEGISFEAPELVKVTLTEPGEGERERIVMTAGDSGMLAAGGGGGGEASSADAGGSEMAESGQSPAPGAPSVLPAARSSAASAGGMAAAAELTMERAPGSVRLEGSRGGSPSRRERLPELGRREQADRELPENAAEPMGERELTNRDKAVFEDKYEDAGERINIEAEAAPTAAVWAGEEKRHEAAPGRRVPLQSEPAEVEAVELEPTLAMVEPRGRRRHSDAMAVRNPEPRVEINDPRRDATREAQPVAALEAQDEPFGAEEARVEMATGGAVPDKAMVKRGVAVGGAESTGLESGGSAKPVVFESSRTESSSPGRRENRPGRMAGGGAREAPQRDLELSVQDAGTPGGGSGKESSATGEAPEDSLGEGRYDGKGSGSQGDINDLYDALASDGAKGGGAAAGRGTLKASKLGNGEADGSGSGDRAEFADGAGGGGTLREGGPSGGGTSRRSGRGDNAEPGVGDKPGKGYSGLPGEGAGTGTQPGAGTGKGDGKQGGGGGGPGAGHGGSGPGEGGGSGQGKGPGEGGGTGPGSGTGSGDGYGDGDGFGFGRGSGANHEGRADGLSGIGKGGVGRPDLAGTFKLPSSSLGDQGATIGVVRRHEQVESEWSRNVRKTLRRGVIEASSAVDPDSLLIVVGDFSRLPDSAAGNLFAALIAKRTPGVTVEERGLAPGDPNLGDCLLALATPEEARNWSEDSIRSVADYLANGGHIWIDAEKTGGADAVMARLAKATGGAYGPLPPSHQLSEGGQASGLVIGDSLAAVATSWNWRKDWRYDGARNGTALRFLARSLNFFLSGNADQGIEIADIAGESGLRITQASPVMPNEIVAPEPAGSGKVWQRFPPGAEAGWRTASWGDALTLSTIGDGRGGRVLKLDFDASSKGRMALSRTLNPPENLSRANELTMDVYYDGSGAATLSLILTAPRDNAWVDYELPPATLRKGWNRLSFHLRGGLFRLMAESGRDYDAELSGADRLGRVGFMVYRKGDGPGMILIGDLSVHDD